MSLDHLHQNLVNRGVLFASYRLPDEDDIFSVVQLSGSAKSVGAERINNEPGFLISPFNTKVEKPIWIEPDAVFKNGDFQAGMKHWKDLDFTPEVVDFNEPKCISRADYIEKIQQLKIDIHTGSLKKAVFTRVFKTDLNNWSGTDLFKALIDRYPTAFVYLINLPGGISWIGASPETLLKVKGRDLETMALAGTREKTSQSVEWGEKESVEQHFVEQHIEDVLLSKGLTFTKAGPHTYRTGSNIEHIRTLYSSTDSNSNTWDILDKLHPTPAVCGLPVELSKKWLEENEGYNRSFYSGYLGPVNMNGSSNLFVNLRCAQIFNEMAYIFVGGGITESSDPQHEWKETELKSQTLLNIIESKAKI